MAGLSIVVCLPPEASADVVAAIDRAMAPFEAQRGYPPERDQWDRWAVQGGADGFGFRVRPGFENDPRLIHDQPHWRLGPQPSPAGMCTGGPRELLDLAGPGAEAEVAAGRLWDLYHELRVQLPAPRPRAHFVARPENQVPHLPVGRNADGEYHLLPDPGQERAERQYGAQPLVRALRAAPYYGAGVVGRLPEMLPWFDLPRPAYVARRAEEALRQSELLTLDGWWIEWNSAPVHGACESHTTCPHDTGRDRWSRADMAAYLEHLPDGVIIVQLHCKV
ncbi:hypothetical protein [Dactylosporangium sp. NPDC051541]|uniref:hypothetical protein n=1 Tax=Dactylosporangium sp. NPDC051541 TaxID=3363977 RepID=UPI0037A4B815